MREGTNPGRLRTNFPRNIVKENKIRPLSQNKRNKIRTFIEISRRKQK